MAVAATPSLDTRVVNLLTHTRRIHHDQFNDNIDCLPMACYSMSYVSFCKFLISRGADISWEECAGSHNHLFSKTREFSAMAKGWARAYGELSTEFRGCKVLLSNLLRLTPTNDKHHWFDFIRHLTKPAFGKDRRNHPLIDSIDHAFGNMIGYQHSITEFWRDQIELLAALDSPGERARRLKPERLRVEIAGWGLLRIAFQSTNSALPVPGDLVETSPYGNHTNNIQTPITPSLVGLVTNAATVMQLLSNILALAPIPNSISNTLTEIRADVFAEVGRLKCYLEACGNICHAHQQFYDHHLRRGSEWHREQLALAESTSGLRGTAQRALDGWVILRSRFMTGSRRISGFCLDYMVEEGGAHDAHLGGQPETQKASVDFERDRIQAKIECGADMHPSVIEYLAALRSMRRYACDLYAFWKKQEDYLDSVARSLKSGQKPTDDDMRYEVDMWEASWKAGFPHSLEF